MIVNLFSELWCTYKLTSRYYDQYVTTLQLGELLYSLDNEKNPFMEFNVKREIL